MARSLQIAPEGEGGEGHAVTFVLAIGPVRQVCRLSTTFRTQKLAFNYLHKYRREFELAARTRLARGEIADGVIHLTML